MKEAKTEIVFYWKKIYELYFQKYDMELKAKNLKSGLDKISQRYVEHFVTLFPYCVEKEGGGEAKYIGNKWTEYDIITLSRKEEFEKAFKQPFPKILSIDPYIYSNIYGLVDLPKSIFDSIDGKNYY